MASELEPCPFCGSNFKIGREPHDNDPVAGMFYIFHEYGPIGSEARKCKLDIQCHFNTEEEAVAFWNTRPAPAATDTGLKTIGFVPPMFVEGKGADYNDIFRSVSIAENYTAVVTRSQADELLAAERAEKEELDAECRVLAKRCIEKDARVKELEEYFDKCISNETFFEQDARRVRQIEALEDKLEAVKEERDLLSKANVELQGFINERANERDEWQKRAEKAEAKLETYHEEYENRKEGYEKTINSLEEKLAAAEMALEPFVSFFNEAMKGFTEGYAERTPSDKPVLGWNNAYLLMRHFIEARAVLGGKPS